VIPGVLAAVENGLAIRTGWTLLLALWGTTVVALLLASWRTLRPQARSAQQHRAAALALAGCVVVLLIAPVAAVTVAQARTANAAPSNSRATSTDERIPRSVTVAAPAPVALGVAPATMNRTAGVIGVVWLAPLSLPPMEVPRSMLTTRPAAAPAPDDLCFDEQHRGFSDGAIVPIRDEPGRFARCMKGSWVESRMEPGNVR
jgi:hypothetical protein